MAKDSFMNEKGQRVAFDVGTRRWRVYNPQADRFGQFAKAPPASATSPEAPDSALEEEPSPTTAVQRLVSDLEAQEAEVERLLQRSTELENDNARLRRESQARQQPPRGQEERMNDQDRGWWGRRREGAAKFGRRAVMVLGLAAIFLVAYLAYKAATVPDEPQVADGGGGPEEISPVPSPGVVDPVVIVPPADEPDEAEEDVDDEVDTLIKQAALPADERPDSDFAIDIVAAACGDVLTGVMEETGSLETVDHRRTAIEACDERREVLQEAKADEVQIPTLVQTAEVEKPSAEEVKMLQSTIARLRRADAGIPAE